MCQTQDPDYGNDLDKIITKYKKLRVWCSGHTHTSRDVCLESVRLYANCVGYKDELDPNCDLGRVYSLIDSSVPLTDVVSVVDKESGDPPSPKEQTTNAAQDLSTCGQNKVQTSDNNTQKNEEED